MAVNIAGEIEKEYGPVSFNNPTVTFGYNSIEIRERLTPNEKNFWGLSAIALLAFIFFINPPVIFVIIIFVAYLTSSLFNNYHLFDKLLIDFNQKEISRVNRFLVVNFFRKVFRNPLVVSFKEIAHFSAEAEKFSIRSEAGTRLLVKSFDHSPMLIGRFRFEIDARRLGELLQHYIVGKPVLNR